jgi:6-phosphogluconate dehydrogenase
MNIGFIGLGRMGQGIAERLINHNHHVIGFDFNQAMCTQAQQLGVTIAQSIADIAQQTSIIWIMVPAGKPVDDVLEQLQQKLHPPSIIIDGGNSHFKDSIRRHDTLAQQHIAFLDCGTSGGLHGKEVGYSLMVGGDRQAYEQALPMVQSIAAPEGYAYMGPTGSGHYVKMVHNGIEYALLQAYAEGLHLLKDGHYKNLDLATITNVWNHGSIIRSWIMNLAHNIYKKDSSFNDISGAIGENKTGQWALEEAEQVKVPMDLLKKSLEIRTQSRQSGGNYATKLVALLRHEFGGHMVEKK